MPREITWGTNWRGEIALSADDFIKQKEALDPLHFQLPERKDEKNAVQAKTFLSSS